MRNFTQQLLYHVVHQPDKNIIIFQKTGEKDLHLSYNELFTRSQIYSDALIKASVKQGEVVVIILQHSLELIFAYFGSILNGSIPSIMPFLTEKLLPEKYRDDLVSLIKITKPSAIITYTAFCNEVDSLISDAKSIKTTLISEYIEKRYINLHERSLWEPPGLRRNADDIALLQHSSGSTGLQKGVALSHQAVFNQIGHYSQAINLKQEDVIVSWLPLYHDMGLIACFLMPILFGTPLVIMSPFDWVRAPHRLLKSVSDYHGTLCWLPNFAYNFCAKKIRESDIENVTLSSLRAVINCSEPMRYESHQMFIDRFSSKGLKKEALATCYAMAENVFAVTQDGINKPVTYDRVDLEAYHHDKYAKPAKEGGQSIIMVSAGRPIEHTQVRIVDQESNILQERHIGEIIIKSDCMLTEYYNRKDDTMRSFSDGWFKTGDLGYIADGELYISGRNKDLIIVGGKNIYPQDIEDLVSSIDGVHPGRVVAFGIFNEEKGTEDVVVIAEVEMKNNKTFKDLVLEIKQNVTKKTAISLRNVYLVQEKWLIKTSSGKIARAANKEKYLKESAI